MPQKTDDTEKPALIKELSRRRVYVFFSLFMFLAFIGLLREESDKWSHVIDDIVMVVTSGFVLFLAWLWRKKQSLKDLNWQHTIFTLIFIVSLIFQIAALPIEISDKEDFGNDIPSVILVVLTLLNKFI